MLSVDEKAAPMQRTFISANTHSIETTVELGILQSTQSSSQSISVPNVPLIEV